MAIITVKNLSKTYKDNGAKLTAFENLSFEVEEGEFVCIIGPSGCGKSTLLRVMAGLMKSSRGKVKVDRKKMAMVFQDAAIFPWLSVEQNVGFGLKMAGLSKSTIGPRIHQHISDMGLNGFESQHPRELSGGMKQRVGIARALAVEPEILLMDEPFSALDALTAKQLRADVMGIWEKRRMTVVMVTHLIEEAVELADKIIVLSPRPGKIERIVEVKLPRPRKTRSTDFYRYVDAFEKLIMGTMAGRDA